MEVFPQEIDYERNDTQGFGESKSSCSATEIRGVVTPQAQDLKTMRRKGKPEANRTTIFDLR